MLDSSSSSKVVAAGSMMVVLAEPVSPDGLFGAMSRREREEPDVVTLQ